MRRCLTILLCLWSMGAVAQPQAVTVGSKKFTESVILGELAAVLGEANGMATEHRSQLGGTRVLWEALKRGDIDVYPEYSGTLREEIFAGEDLQNLDAVRRRLAREGISMTAPLGFENNYALAVRPELAAGRGLRQISDLSRHGDLRLGFSNEFMDRADGWPGLRQAYGLKQTVRGLDHDLAYRGLAGGSIDVTDAYTTDPEIAYYDLVLLEDDRGYFVRYEPLYLYRTGLEDSAPAYVAALRSLQDAISAGDMRAMNKAVKLDGRTEAAVAAQFLEERYGLVSASEEAGRPRRIVQTSMDHLILVAISLSAAILIAVPLGVVAWRMPSAGRFILSAVGVIQTIPSLAIFVFMIPLVGIGGPPAILALFLYSLLPIVRNTYAGLANIERGIRESAIALGLPARARLWRIELPLAARTIFAGIKTAAVINVGTATLAALIGAGGYGQPILTGIRLDNTALILEGAIPAAILALLFQYIFGLVEKLAVPRGLRL